ncbi:hypothetical protein E3U55_03370 [Filobacillus milosensis]|uniref:Uncharacterized protein n=1 Tax=Filobacillus milosensis TaxID=94137 RepID=A0A4Y8IQL7_9BACI|nr:hypothetical protein [Filobacillus milosensis]TFB23868.1 hypothetical protein E3U55_03370 [Filobacillus milosensis]
MTKKKIQVILLSGVILVALFLIYWFYFSKPTDFPSDQQLAKEINQIFPKADVDTIQDTIILDSEHVFVPFVSSNEEYGSSYWTWEKHKWKPVYINTVGDPLVWRIDSKDPSSSFIVWNIHPRDNVNYMRFYMIRDRGYHISYGIHTYIPQIQMEKQLSLKEQGYGVLKLPIEWGNFLTRANRLAKAQNPNVTFNSLLPDASVYIGWMPYNSDDELVFPENSVNGHGFINGDIETDFVRLLNEIDLE